MDLARLFLCSMRARVCVCVCVCVCVREREREREREGGGGSATITTIIICGISFTKFESLFERYKNSLWICAQCLFSWDSYSLCPLPICIFPISDVGFAHPRSN